MSPELNRPIEPLTEEQWATPIELTYRGKPTTYTLKEWLGFCTEDNLDPNEVQRYGRELLAGRLPFNYPDISIGHN